MSRRRCRTIVKPEEINGLLLADSDSDGEEVGDLGNDARHVARPELCVEHHVRRLDGDALEAADDDTMDTADNDIVEEDVGANGVVSEINSEYWFPLNVDTIGNNILEKRDVSPKFTGTPGPMMDTTGWEPVDYFLQFFPSSCIKKIVTETNRYAVQFFDRTVNIPESSRFFKWVETCENEIRAYIALELAMGLVSKPSLVDYWETWWLSQVPGFSSVMSRNRFQLLRTFLHFNDNETRAERNSPNYDILHKIRPLIEEVMPMYTEAYFPSQELSVDESLRKFKGRIFYKQYLPKKPDKWGIKIWSLCDARNGYMINWKVYTGAEVGVSTSTKSVVIDLCTPMHESGRIVYYDNFFSSPTLSLEMKSKGLGTCGTVRPNRVGLPEEVRKGNLHLKKGDDPIFFHHSETDFTVCAWHDVKLVHMLSSVHGNQNIQLQIRTRHTDGGHRHINKPAVMVDYNQFMSGVDRMDQRMCYYKFPHKSTKHYHVIYHFIKEIAMVNGYILYEETTEDVMTSKSFRKSVIEGLLKPFLSKKQTTNRRALQHQENRDGEERLTGRHFPAQFENMKRKPDCIVCSDRKNTGRKQTNYCCPNCPGTPAMCPTECFKRYHTLKNYKMTVY